MTRGCREGGQGGEKKERKEWRREDKYSLFDVDPNCLGGVA